LRSTAIAFAVPAKAGTHLSARSAVLSDGNGLPILLASCPGTMDPGFRRGCEKISSPSLTPNMADDRTSMILPWVSRNDAEQQVSSADVVAFNRAVARRRLTRWKRRPFNSPYFLSPLAKRANWPRRQHPHGSPPR